MDAHRKTWNDQQRELKASLSSAANHAQTVRLFLRQHAMLHSAIMLAGESQSGDLCSDDLWSFEDEVFSDLEEQTIRSIPGDGEHSIAWMLWHIARIEDITMNLLIASTEWGRCTQVLFDGHWLEQMYIDALDTGNLMPAEAIARLSAAINIGALRAYRAAVGQRTRDIIRNLPAGAFQQKVNLDDIQRISNEGAVVNAAADLLAYWSRLTKGGLLLMPATRHNFVHLNEALRAKAKLLRSRQTSSPSPNSINSAVLHPGSA